MERLLRCLHFQQYGMQMLGLALVCPEWHEMQISLAKAVLFLGTNVLGN